MSQSRSPSFPCYSNSRYVLEIISVFLRLWQLPAILKIALLPCTFMCISRGVNPRRTSMDTAEHVSTAARKPVFRVFVTSSLFCSKIHSLLMTASTHCNHPGYPALNFNDNIILLLLGNISDPKRFRRCSSISSLEKGRLRTASMKSKIEHITFICRLNHEGLISEYYTIENRGEVIHKLLKLSVIVGEHPSSNRWKTYGYLQVPPCATCGTWPIVQLSPEKVTFLMMAQCWSIFSGCPTLLSSRGNLQLNVRGHQIIVSIAVTLFLWRYTPMFVLGLLESPSPIFVTEQRVTGGFGIFLVVVCFRSCLWL